MFPVPGMISPMLSAGLNSEGGFFPQFYTVQSIISWCWLGVREHIIMGVRGKCSYPAAVGMQRWMKRTGLEARHGGKPLRDRGRRTRNSKLSSSTWDFQANLGYMQSIEKDRTKEGGQG